MSEARQTYTYGNVAVLGLGKTGVAVALYMSSCIPSGRVVCVTVFGGAASTPENVPQELRACGCQIVCATDEVCGSFDTCISSPGIAPDTALFRSAKAHASTMMGEPELAWRESPERWIGITGTNGKTTTTTLVRNVLLAGGERAAAVGNIGAMAISEVAHRQTGEWLVAELSSFQLAGTLQLHPHVGILLNITPDHLAWHKTMEKYAAAKERLFAHLDEHDLAIIADSDAWCRAISERVRARHIPVCRLLTSGKEPGADEAYAAWERCDGLLMVRLGGHDTQLVRADELIVRGEHNIENVLCAAATGLFCGVDPADVRRALTIFQPLEHRIEPCGELHGVQFVNDSKATNTDAVRKALTAFDAGSVVLLLGGHDKGTDLNDMARDIVQTARVVVCFGEAGPRLAQAVREALAAQESSHVEVCEAAHLEQALDAGIAAAHSGDVVLLSPACSSFDEFSGFEERGDTFKRLVAERIQAQVRA